MEESTSSDLEYLLDGKALPSGKMIIDVKEKRERYVPVVKQTVTYIAASVLFNDRGEIVMMQEAKSSCRGRWYLPAGRMEPNETIEQAAQREVLEETGLVFSPTTVLHVEAPSSYWFRFTLTGNITGGSLKTYNAKDPESLQAQWFSFQTISTTLELRARDILPLIESALKWQTETGNKYILRPVVTPHTKLLARLVVVPTCTNDSESVQVLVGLREHVHLPIVCIDYLYGSVNSLLLMAVSGESIIPRVVGVLGIEHDGRPAHQHDGLCLTLLVTVDAPAGSLTLTDPTVYRWLNIRKPAVIQRLHQLIDSELLPTCRC